MNLKSTLVYDVRAVPPETHTHQRSALILLPLTDVSDNDRMNPKVRNDSTQYSSLNYWIINLYG